MKDTTLKDYAAKLSDHATERKAFYGLILLGLVYGAGYWNGTRVASGRGEAIKRQLEGTLTLKEQAITAGDAELGKVKTELHESRDVQATLQASNSDLASRAASLERQYGLMAGQYQQLSAWVTTTLKNGQAGALPAPLAGSTTPECGACKGAIAFGSPQPYARCWWGDYAAAKTGGGANLDLNMGVKIDTVTLRQKPQDGALEAVLGKVFLTDSAGVVLAEGKLDPASKVFTAAPATGDLYRRRIWIQGGVGPAGYRLNFLTQKGIKPLGWGIGATRDWKGKVQPEAVLSFQIR